VVESTWRTKISTGLAELIEVSMGERCGGVVGRTPRMLLGVSSPSTSARMMRMRTRTKIRRKKPESRDSSASAAR